MSPEIPPAPPEAEVLRLAREAADMTAQSAAEATRTSDGRGVSASYWRDVERGHGGRRGRQVPTRASARALAAMARVVGVRPAQLTGAGREDAARVLEEILRREARLADARLLPAPVPGTGIVSSLPREIRIQVLPYLADVDEAVREARANGAHGPLQGRDVFPGDPDDAQRWDENAARHRRIMGEEPSVQDVADMMALSLWKAAERRSGSGNSGMAAGR
jgi:hypothetical protein